MQMKWEVFGTDSLGSCRLKLMSCAVIRSSNLSLSNRDVCARCCSLRPDKFESVRWARSLRLWCPVRGWRSYAALSACSRGCPVLLWRSQLSLRCLKCLFDAGLACELVWLTMCTRIYCQEWALWRDSAEGAGYLLCCAVSSFVSRYRSSEMKHSCSLLTVSANFLVPRNLGVQQQSL